MRAAFLASFLSMWAVSSFVRADDNSWRAPLAQKADIFEENVLARHWIDGLYPSQVEVQPDGSVDLTTQSYANVAHSINWTAYYLGGQVYRYLFTRDPAVRAHVNEVFEAIYRCQLVTGVRGLQARGYVYGHGDSYEERGDTDHADDWHQGAGEYADYRWRGSPSHHNYSGGIYALGMYYDLVAEGEWKDRAREAIDALVGYWANEEDFIIRKLDGSVSTPILGFTDGRTPNTRVIMAAAGLRVAYHATGKAIYREKYEALTDQYQFRTWRDPIPGRDSFDDTDHVLQHMENMLRIEDDPELRAFYEHVTRDLWDAHRNDKQSLFNVIVYGLLPDEPGKEKALADALWTLQSFPTQRIFRPRMNSLRTDIEIVDGRAKNPLPMYESPWDNEYQWKGNLYQLDGWLSRVVVSLAVPAEDPAVIYATDTSGDIYKTVNGGRRWVEISENLPAAARYLAAGPRVRMLYVVASDGLYRSATAGERWQRLPLPTETGAPVEVHVAPENPNVLYVVTERGIYRSLDYGQKWIGERWESLTTNLPPARSVRLHVAFGDPNLYYAVLDDVVYHRAEGESDWQKGDALNVGGYVQVYPWLVSDPQNASSIFSAFRSDVGQLAGHWLSVSEDAGKTWSLGLRTIYEKYKQGELLSLLASRLTDEINAFVIDPHDSDTFYVATRDGILRSTDRGRHWSRLKEGLEVPLVQTLFAPAASNALYAGTPGGLYVSEDRGEHWADANLRLIFESNTQREIGGAGYLDAYWRGRYFGFITEEDANADPSTWSGHGTR